MQREFELKCSYCHSFHFIGVKLKTEEVVSALCLFVHVPQTMKDSHIQSLSQIFLLQTGLEKWGPQASRT